MTLTLTARLQKLKRKLRKTSTALVKVTRNAEQNRRDTEFFQLLEAQQKLLLTYSIAVKSKKERKETKNLLKCLDNRMRVRKDNVRANLQWRYERDKILADQFWSQQESFVAKVAHCNAAQWL